MKIHCNYLQTTYTENNENCIEKVIHFTQKSLEKEVWHFFRDIYSSTSLPELP